MHILSFLKRSPDFMVLGAAKSGTTSLYKYLKQHPQIVLPRLKQIHFFNNDRRYEHGLSWYKSFFPFKWKAKGKVVGDASASYLFCPQSAARIYQHFPTVKLIALLREPVARAYSHYHYLRSGDRDNHATFEEAIDHEFRGEPVFFEDQNDGKNFPYLAEGRYNEWVGKYLALFQREQILFINSAQFFSDPASALGRIYEFIGVDYFVPPDLTPENTRSYVPISEESMKRLENHYADANQKLVEVLGEDFRWRKS